MVLFWSDNLDSCWVDLDLIFRGLVQIPYCDTNLQLLSFECLLQLNEIYSVAARHFSAPEVVLRMAFFLFVTLNNYLIIYTKLNNCEIFDESCVLKNNYKYGSESYFYLMWIYIQNCEKFERFIIS